MTDGLASSYAEARSAFLAAAAAAGARVRHHRHPQQGLEGEDLFVDVAEIGPPDARDVLLIVSGTHGIEGYLGSALQTRHLRALERSEPRPPTLVLVHALNPSGFSWVRRSNEDNVDLNRDFIDWTQPPPGNEGYGDLADALVPMDWSDDTQRRTLTELLGHAETLGLEGLQQVVSGGQWSHPAGVFYGGSQPAWSNTWLRTFLAERLRDVARAGIVDVHTGLGPWGHGELISPAAPSSSTFERQRRWSGEVTSLQDGSSVSAELAGEWLGVAAALAPQTEVTGVALEFGTVDPITVLQSLRASAVLHAHGDPTAADAAAVRAQVRAAFLDDDPAWFAVCATRYDEVIDAATAQLV